MIKERLLEKWPELPGLKTPAGIPLEPVRLLHGQGEKDSLFSSLNLDFFPPLLFLTLYKPMDDSVLKELTDELLEFLGPRPLLVQDRSSRPAKFRVKLGDIPGELILREEGLNFFLHPERGQNPGFFTDMRSARRKVEDILKKNTAQEKKLVLNLFAYTCAFSVVSLAAGADKVVNIDMNRRSLDIGRKNHEINLSSLPGGYRGKALFLPHDIFKSFGRLKREGPYQLIIADPPPSQKGSFDLRKDYPRLIRHLPEMLLPGGQILFSLNHPGWSWQDFESMLLEEFPEKERMERIPPPRDFRTLNEEEGLKLILYQR